MQEPPQQVNIQINTVMSVVFSKQLNGNFSKQISKSLYLQKQIGYPTCGAGRGIQWNKSVVARCAIIRTQATSYSLYCNLVAEV